MPEGQINNSLLVKINTPINPINRRTLQFYGSADGTNLTRKYVSADIKDKWCRLIAMDFFYYGDGSNILIRELAEDNKTFTSNSNSRYATVRPDARIDSLWVEKMAGDSTYNMNIQVDNNPLNIFNGNDGTPAYDHLDLNLLPQNQIQDGIDIAWKIDFYYDQEGVGAGALSTHPIIKIDLHVELLNDIAPLTINNNQVNQ